MLDALSHYAAGLTMTLVGFYHSEADEPPAPYIKAQVILPDLGVAGEVNFLIDTGADVIFLHPEDVAHLGIAQGQLNPEAWERAAGIGGGSGYYRETAVLLFQDSAGRELRCDLNVFIHPGPDSDLQDAPSLLGRDFLNRCDVRLNRAQSLARLEPVNLADTAILPAE